MTKEQSKKQFREYCIKRLKKISKSESYLKDKKIQEKLYTIIKTENAKNIMLYLPLSMEANLYPLVCKLRKENCMLYVPFMEGSSFRLVKYRLPLRKKQFGIKEPNNSRQYRKKQIDVAIVPIVGLDATLRRVGFGKGMYDRFFEKNKKNIKKVVFVARELCYIRKVITDYYDIKADSIITAT